MFHAITRNEVQPEVIFSLISTRDMLIGNWGSAFKTFAFNSLHVDDFERLSMNQNLFSNIICQVKKPIGVLVPTSTEILTLFS